MRPNRLLQRGNTLVGAIFLLTVLAVLGAYMVTLSGVTQATTNRALLGARVYYGAKAGLEWGIQSALAQGVCSASTGFGLTEGTLQGIALTVTCTSTAEGSTGGVVYYLTSLASYGTSGQDDYVERKLETTVSNLS